MSASHAHAHDDAGRSPGDIRQRLRHLAEHLEHVLPGQAPLRDFVHHNTLHGYQQLPFPKALASSRRVTGIYGYLPSEQLRQAFQQGRARVEELDEEIVRDGELAAQRVIAPLRRGPLHRLEVYRAAILHDLTPITPAQLTWRIVEEQALTRIQSDVSEESRRQLRQSAGGAIGEPELVGDLWRACLAALEVEESSLHPEELVDLSPTQARQWLARLDPPSREKSGEGAARRAQWELHREVDRLLNRLMGWVGPEWTLRRALLALTGVDLMDDLRPGLLRHLAAFLDHGLASWIPERREEGFYALWRRSALEDLTFIPDDLPDWREEIESFSGDALEAIVQALSRLGLPEKAWESYLERLALELPGWSGMVMWRHVRPGYQGLPQVEMLEYLAVRLLLERLYAMGLCRRMWRVEPRLETLRSHFRAHGPEFFARWMLFNEPLPEYLASRAQRLLRQSPEDPADEGPWGDLAQRIQTWRFSPEAEGGKERTPQGHAWPLFRLAQHVGVSGGELRAFSPAQRAELWECLERMDDERIGYLGLLAYERRYREEIFHVLSHNHGRGRWARRESPPAAQAIFCMDDREEGIRRHLEESDPEVETLGAAGFFGTPIWWRGLDDADSVALCPVVTVPSHDLREVPPEGPEAAARHARHQRRREQRLTVLDHVQQGTARGLLSPLMTAAAAPAGWLQLVGRLFLPRAFGQWVKGLEQRWDPPVSSRVALTAREERPASPEAPRLGFTDAEQADRVEGFLRTIGLTYGFAPIVAVMGHGSSSRNNPHLAAYDCGACSGRHGGPNARVFAAMANRPEVRETLRQRRIDLPDGTWFLGAEHNTGDETLEWYDLDVLPESARAPFERLRQALENARKGSAHERARRLASAPRHPTPEEALAHFQGRTQDISQARPELGHATNAAALIGRRSVTQGAFFDRRLFLISYDPTQDPEGKIVENILLNAGPVGAGISLEYYFSTVNNDRFGCGSKVTHNVTGLMGVMEGASSDLRTGLPKQMIEIHEAMRLLVVVEQRPTMLTAIYQRQPALQELVGNGWLQLAALDPVDGGIHLFRPGEGWRPWRGSAEPPPRVRRSSEWYAGHDGPLPPALIAQPGEQVHG
ncbi:MAG: DUF2309 domain-containing protein [Magnetococcales bacterium]|nr:DUF2309 domain-containing protein [Magnetococcales bacterium]